MGKDPSEFFGQKYAEILKMFGDNHKGVYWPKLEDTFTRYRVMTDLIKKDDTNAGRISLLDFGCGAGHYFEYLKTNFPEKINYCGLDITKESVDLCRTKFPENMFYQLNINQEADKLPYFDYVVMNGVFTVKWDIPKEQMFEYVQETLINTFKVVKVGLAVNFLSTHVDWQREDLFHLEFDKLAGFIYKNLSKKLVIRQDYGLYEYTSYVYR